MTATVLRSMLSALLVFGLSTRTATAQSSSVYIEDLTWPEIRDAISRGASAIIYAGSTEQNGPHMALGKHNVVAHHVAGLIAQQLGNALVYPTLPFAPAGNFEPKSGHMRFAGTVSLSLPVFESVLTDVARSALTAGFKHVFLMGDHGGGQNELKHVAEQLDAVWKPKGARVHYIPDLYFRTQEQEREYLNARGIEPGTHASARDTSELMYLDTANRWIRRDRLAPSDSTQEPTSGVAGDPTKSTPEMGRVFIGYKVTNAVAQIRQQMKG